eukprot:COSAG03_NODE_3190_length_2152_cov_2.035558_2_plen_269_part_00
MAVRDGTLQAGLRDAPSCERRSDADDAMMGLEVSSESASWQSNSMSSTRPTCKLRTPPAKSSSSLELLHQFYTAAAVFRIPHSSSSPAAPAEGGATESEAIVRALRGEQRQELPHLRFLGLQRLATMVEYSSAHRCDIFSSEDTWREVTHICAEQTTRMTQELRALKQQTHVSYNRRADLGWPELMVNLLVSPLRSVVEIFDRCLVFLGQYDGRYEVAFSQSQPLVWSLRYARPAAFSCSDRVAVVLRDRLGLLIACLPACPPACLPD